MALSETPLFLPKTFFSENKKDSFFVGSSARHSTEDNCSHVAYESRIHLPDFFSLYWKEHDMKMGIAKHVCVHGQAMRETLVISDIPFVDDDVLKGDICVPPQK